MNLDEFSDLTMEEKANYVWQHAIFIDSCFENEKAINLYYCHGFYTEISICARRGKILEIAGFSSIRRLEKYLRKIRLHELI